MNSMKPEIPEGAPKYLYLMLQNCIGKEKAVFREEILDSFQRYYQMKLDDRSLRMAVEAVRNCGIRLVDFEDGNGIFIAKTEEEYNQFRSRYGKHAFSLLRTIRAMDKGMNANALSELEIENTNEIYQQSSLLR